MGSTPCKIVSFLLTASYRLTALVGLLTILITSDPRLASFIIFGALILFTISHYIESYVCRYHLRKYQPLDKWKMDEEPGLIRRLESSEQRLDAGSINKQIIG